VQQYVARRVLQAVPIVMGITVITFALVHAAPGNPFSHLVNPDVSPEAIQEKMEELGLNKPLPVQYFGWLKQLLQGNMGWSIRYSRPVAEMIGEKLGPTLLLTTTAMIVSVLLAIPIGVVSAVRQYSPLDYAVTFAAFVGISIPVFFLALLCVYFFGLVLGLCPTSGMVTPGQPYSFLDVLHHLVLPATVLSAGAIGVAQYVRYARSSMLEVIRQDYIRTARAKGLSERVVVYKHALRNALIPVITMIGINVPFLFSGAIITEAVFTWPGMGTLGWKAVLNRDYPVLMGVNLVFAVMVVAGNLLADLCYALVDPRIRYD